MREVRRKIGEKQSGAATKDLLTQIFNGGRYAGSKAGDMRKAIRGGDKRPADTDI